MNAAGLIVCVLAGGASRRFEAGSKLDLFVHGEPILSYLAKRFSPVAASAWLVVSPLRPKLRGEDQYRKIVVDPAPHQGPLAAMGHVLSQCDPKDHVAFLAADMPLVTPELLTMMHEALRAGRAAGVMGRWIGGERHGLVEPLPGVYRAGPAYALIRSLLARGIQSVSHLGGLDEIATFALPRETYATQMVNINRVDDLSGIRGVSIVAADE